MCGSEGTERQPEFEHINDGTNKRDGIEWDIDANLPLYTRDYLRLGVARQYQGVGGDAPKSFQWGIAEDSQDASVAPDGIVDAERKWKKRWIKTVIQEELVAHGLIPDDGGFMHIPKRVFRDAPDDSSSGDDGGVSVRDLPESGIPVDLNDPDEDFGLGKYETDLKARVKSVFGDRVRFFENEPERDALGRIDLVAFMRDQVPKLVADEIEQRDYERSLRSIDHVLRSFGEGLVSHQDVDVKGAEELGRSISRRQDGRDGGDSRPPTPDSEHGGFRRGWFWRRKRKGN